MSLGTVPLGTVPTGMPQQSHDYSRADFCESLNKIARREQPESPRQAALMTKIQDYTKYHLQQKKVIAPGITGTNFSNVLYMEGNDDLDPVGAEWRYTNVDEEALQIIKLNAGMLDGTLQSMECDTLELDRILMGENAEPPRPYTDTVRAALPFAGHDGHGNATVLFHALNPATAAVLQTLLRADKETKEPVDDDQLGYARAAWLAILMQKDEPGLRSLRSTLFTCKACTDEQAQVLLDFARQLKASDPTTFDFPVEIEAFLGSMTDKLLEVQNRKLIKNVALGREKVTRPSGDADRAHVFSLMTATNSVGVVLENEYINEQGQALGRHISISHPGVINDCLGMKAENPHAQQAYITDCCSRGPIIVRNGSGFEVMFVDPAQLQANSANAAQVDDNANGEQRVPENIVPPGTNTLPTPVQPGGPSRDGSESVHNPAFETTTSATGTSSPRTNTLANDNPTAPPGTDGGTPPVDDGADARAGSTPTGTPSAAATAAAEEGVNRGPQSVPAAETSEHGDGYQVAARNVVGGVLEGLKNSRSEN